MKIENKFPNKTIETIKIDKNTFNNIKDKNVSITWLGHSTILIKTKNITIITDPIFNKKRIPPLNLGPKPFPYSNAYDIENLPKIDI